MLGLAAVCALCDVCIRLEGRAIEDDLTARVTDALNASEAWVSRVLVFADGQTILLAGKAPDAATRDQAVELALQVWGVERVVNQIELSMSGGQPDRAPGAALVSPSGVSSQACQVELNQTLMQGRIEFTTGASVLEEWSYPALDRMAEIAGTCAASSVEVAVYTDEGGDAESNQKLSQARAEALVYYLLRKGVHPSRLTARGYGAESHAPDAKRHGWIELRVTGL
ncbi:MAG: OmpA family protein [Bryobacterales bacterium]